MSRRAFKRLICNVYVRAGWTLPASVRSFYILESLQTRSAKLFAAGL